MSTTIRSIMLAYDGSVMSRRAAEIAGEMAQRKDARVKAVHVLELPHPILSVEAAVSAPPEVELEFRAAAKDLLEQARNLLPDVAEPRGTLLTGSSAMPNGQAAI